mgnify:CR=1 FL=1
MTRRALVVHRSKMGKTRRFAEAIAERLKALGVERTNLHKKIKQLGLSRGGRGAAAEPGEADEG